MQTIQHTSNSSHATFASAIDYDAINATVDRIEAKDPAHKIFSSAPKILLIEDEPLIQRVNLMFLKLLGCRVELAQNGQEAIAMLTNGYDLILTDIGLPDLDGREVARRIRQQELAKQIPIIALTAYDNFIIKECYEAGMNDFYVKPLKLKELGGVLKRWLPQYL